MDLGSSLHTYIGATATPAVLLNIKDTANNYLNHQLATTGTGTGAIVTDVTYDIATNGLRVHTTNDTASITIGGTADSGAIYRNSEIDELERAVNHEWTWRVNSGGSVTFDTADPKTAKRSRIKSNLIIPIKSRALPPIRKEVPENEQVAMETLREMVTEQEFRKYLKYGFVLVPGVGGKTYQVFKNRSHTKVWKNGKIVEEICVRIKSYDIPQTDNVIAFMSMIQASEEDFRKLGNVYNMVHAA
jgi:hypothetical protein